MTMYGGENGKKKQPSLTEKKMQLPILSINTMSEGQLRDFIPKLLSMVKSNMEDKTEKPDWWPSDLPWSDTQTHIKYHQASWADTLRNVVRCCYKHLGQEKLLQESSKDKIKTSYNSTFPVTISPSLLECLQQSTIVSEKKVVKETRRRYSEIFICFFCEKEFCNKSEMRAHQMICEERPPQLLVVPSPPRDLSPKEGNLPPPISPDKMHLSESFVKISKDRFVQAIGMVQKQKAAKILARNRFSSMDIDCNLDFHDFEEPETPISPPTPRTPKSLMSQLSKDDGLSASRKRLSYSNNDGDINDKESVKSSDSNDEERPSHVNKSLMNIDVSSLLGQRIVKYMKDETNLVIVKDSESFCRTPDKNEYYDKLRHRSNQYPIFYRPRKSFDVVHSHQYKFTRKQRKKASTKIPIKKIKHKKSEYKPPTCNVALKRLTKADLQRWLPKRDVKNTTDEMFFDENNNDLFPKIPILHTKECDKLLGLKKRSLRRLNTMDPLSLTNVVSEDESAEISKQKLTIYRCLLSEINELTPFLSMKKGTNTKPGSGRREEKPKPRWSSSKYKQFKSMKSKDDQGQMSWLKNETALAQVVVEQQLSNFLSDRVSPTRSVDDFTVKRNGDDNISILSLSISSDDGSYNSACCSECRRKKRCMCSPLSVSSPPNVPINQSCGSKLGNSPQTAGPCLREISDTTEISNLKTVPSSPVHCGMCDSVDSSKNENDLILNSLPSPPPSAQKKSPSSRFSDTSSEGQSENNLTIKRSSPYKLRISSPRKSYPDFEVYMQRKIQTTALGERINNHCNQNDTVNKTQKVDLALSNKPQKMLSSVSQPDMDVLRRSKRIRSPSSSSLCNDSPAKLRRLETR
ncbi:uncharacterized protein [Mytilus edulis]|uniref:uncharacterized protein isoform X2 n=1 Tax=Mytilus edulis TaxID=6550 RepID=UPI0039EDF92E